MRPMLRLGPLLAFSVLFACDRSPEPSPEPTTTPPELLAELAPQPRPEPVAGPPSALDTYLAAIPAELPELSAEVTGHPVKDPKISIERCKESAWSYRGCSEVYPRQGLQWMRWQCAHSKVPYSDEIMCPRLGLYLHEGVGGPKEPALARALFDRHCFMEKGAFHTTCIRAAEAMMFADPSLALTYAVRACSDPSLAHPSCATVLPALQAGLAARDGVVDKAEGLPAVAVGGACKLWLWSTGPASCGARLACGDAVLYGASDTTFPCTDARTGGDAWTTAKDRDPSIKIDATKVVLSDDKTGKHGAFELTVRLP